VIFLTNQKFLNLLIWNYLNYPLYQVFIANTSKIAMMETFLPIFYKK